MPLLSLGKVVVSPCASNEGMATTEISTLGQALATYVVDELEYPGMGLAPDPERNDFPLLFEALFAERSPRGKGGRNAPYAEFKEDKIAVEVPGSDGYRKATREEIRDPAVKKYLLDPWGNPYVYRAGKARSDAKIYSFGPNEEDDTVNFVEDGDDLGNW